MSAKLIGKLYSDNSMYRAIV